MTKVYDHTTSYMTSAGMNNTNITSLSTAPKGCIVFSFSTFSPWDNPEDLVSYATQKAFMEIVDVYFKPFVFFLSVPLNVVNMIVFWKLGIRERINMCLFFLSSADLIVIVAHTGWKLDKMYSAITNTPYKPIVFKFAINNMIHSLAGFIYVSGFMSLLIAVERCLCVVNPLKAQNIIQTKTTAIIIAVGHVVILGAHFVIATKWRFVCMFDPLIGQTIDAMYSTEFYLRNKDLVDTLEGTVFGILLPGICVLGVSASTVITVIKLRSMAEWRDQSTSSKSAATVGKDITLTRMLIGINLIFVVCSTPALLFRTITAFVPDLALTGIYYNTFYLLIKVQEVCAFVNSSFNFFVYYFFGTKFRTMVNSMFCRHGGSKNKPSNSSTVTTTVSVISNPSKSKW